MNKRIFLLAITFQVFSCGKHIYVLSGKEINGYTEAAKEIKPQQFVVYKNGDTIKGLVIRKMRTGSGGQKIWSIAGKDLEMDQIKSFQDEYGFTLGSYTRILKGKMNLYMSQADDSRLVTSYNSTTKSYQSRTTGGVTTSFYLGQGDEVGLVTFNSLSNAVKDCAVAAKQLDTEFGGGVWKKRPTLNINDYRALIRILEKYNSCK